MYSYHVLLLPAAVVGLVVAHILLVRRHGVVPPFDLQRRRELLGVAGDSPATDSDSPTKDKVAS
jgi:quinol-cytochrome oxidoreductase complex cytochrome b subunit